METNNKVTPEQIAALLNRVEYRFMVVPGTTTTICTALLDGKFTLALGMSACVDPLNFNQATGEEIAKRDATAQATEALWTMEGYRLYQRLREEPELIARLCHEANKAYCESQGDTSQAAWEEAPEWQRVSARNGVAAHLSSDMSPADSHASWMTEKLADGWTYGEVKDPVAKTHPCMVPYSDLPKAQQAKDFIFRGIVNTFKKGGV